MPGGVLPPGIPTRRTGMFTVSIQSRNRAAEPCRVPAPQDEASMTLAEWIATVRLSRYPSRAAPNLGRPAPAA